MHIPKRYFQDKVILLLLIINAFLMVLQIGLLFLNLDSQQSAANLVEYRPHLGLNAYTYSASNSTYYMFMAFSALTVVLHTVLSVRMYNIRRHTSIAILALGTVLLLFSLRVGYALVVQ